MAPTFPLSCWGIFLLLTVAYSKKMAVLSLTRNELEELDIFLLSGATSSSIMALDTLHGFLTATVLGPSEMQLERCLQYIWNNTNAPLSHASAPEEQIRRIVCYIIRIRDDITANLNDPDCSFSPLIMIRANHGKQYADGEMWSYGFLQGIELQRNEWTYFLESPKGRAILRPIHLLGASQLTSQEEKLVTSLRKRSALTARIPAAIEAIGTYFLEVELAALRNGKRSLSRCRQTTAQLH